MESRISHESNEIRLKSDFELQQKVVDWLVSHGVSFHQAMKIYSAAGSLALTIPESYLNLLESNAKKNS